MRVPWTNTGRHRVTVGTVTVAPGDTRDVDPQLLAGYTPPAPPAVEHTHPWLALLDQPVRALVGALTGLTDGDLVALEQAEKDGKTRKGAMAAIAAERLRRSQGV